MSMLLPEMMKASKSVINNFGDEWWSKISTLLFEKFAWVKPDDWRRVCDRINHECTFPPKLSKFYQAVDYCKIGRTSATCEACNGTGGVAVYLRDSLDGGYTTAWWNCPSCKKPSTKDPEYIEAWCKRYENVSHDEFYEINGRKRRPRSAPAAPVAADPEYKAPPTTTVETMTDEEIPF